jgi:hypothetical protein
MNAQEVSLQGHLDELRSETGVEDGGLSTVIFCGKMRSENDSADIMAMHRTVVETEVNTEGTNVTGLLMGQGSSIMHFIEGPSHAVLRILKVIADHEHFQGNKTSGDGGIVAIQQGRVVYSVESRPKRYFPEWYSCVLPEKKGNSEELNGETGKDVVSDLAQSLLDMGTSLQSTSGAVEMSNYSEILPAKGLVLALNNCNAFFTLDEYVALYAEPFHADLESEMSYPLRRLVNY